MSEDSQDRFVGKDARHTLETSPIGTSSRRSSRSNGWGPRCRVLARPYAATMQGMPLLDELMANAWRPRVVETHRGWRYRWADGVTRRANSVLAAGADGDTRGLVDLAEAFYRERHAPSLIQVSTASAPNDLVACLQARRYRPSARTLVEEAATRDVVDRTRATIEIEIAEAPSDEWFDAYWLVEAARGRRETDAAVCRDVLLAPGLPTVFATARRDSDVIGVGQVVTERGWAGVQCMATGPGHRRQGVASSVLNGLAKDALDRGAARMYLAVMTENDAAAGLYQSAGFKAVHEYRYFANNSSDCPGTAPDRRLYG